MPAGTGPAGAESLIHDPDRPEAAIRTRIAALLVALTASLTVAVAPSPVALERWVVGFESLPADLGAVLTSLGATDGVALTTIDAVAVTLPAGAIDVLTARTDVVGARPERRLALHLAESVPFIGADRATLGEPLDVAVTEPDGSTSTITRPAVDGTGQTVAVVDTGVWAGHPDLEDRVIAALDFELAYAGELILDEQQLDDFAAATGPLAGPTDDVGHGTHVAGIVAGTGAASAGRKNANRGVAPGAAIVDIRISPQLHTSDNNIGWERNALAAYDWLVRHHDDEEFGPAGITVANNSWGTGDSTLTRDPLDYEPMKGMLDALDAAGVVVVFSAGNSGPSDLVTEAVIPTGHPTVITVAAGCKPGAASSSCVANDPDRRIASFSSRGPAVDITAPGVDIVSAVNVSSGKALGMLGGDFNGQNSNDQYTNRAWYANFSGTSMSGPHIAGVAALMLEASPTLTPTDVRIIMTATARDLLAPGRDPFAGWGMVDVGAALVAASRHAAGTPVAEQFPGFDTATTL